VGYGFLGVLLPYLVVCILGLGLQHPHEFDKLVRDLPLELRGGERREGSR
jgi:hypothetical protein